MPFRPFIPAKDFHVYSPFTEAVGHIIALSRDPLPRPTKIALRFDEAVKICRDKKHLEQSEAFWLTMRQIAWQAKSTDFDKGIANQESRFNMRQETRVDTYRQSLPFYSLATRWAAQSPKFHAPYAANGQKVLMATDWSNSCRVKFAASMLRSWSKSHDVTPLQFALGESIYAYPCMRS